MSARLQVLAVAGPAAARVVWAEPLAGTHVVRQSEVELSVLAGGEQLSSMWVHRAGSGGSWGSWGMWDSWGIGSSWGRGGWGPAAKHGQV